jgi:hypothetical protein
LRTVLNIVWLVLAGLWLALGYAVAGVIMCILIVTIPFGLQAFKLAGYSLWPFGRTVVKRPEAGGASVVGNIIWLLLARLVAGAAPSRIRAAACDHDHLVAARGGQREARPRGVVAFRARDRAVRRRVGRPRCLPGAAGRGPGAAGARAADPAAGRASEGWRGAAGAGAGGAARELGRGRALGAIPVRVPGAEHGTPSGPPRPAGGVAQEVPRPRGAIGR